MSALLAYTQLLDASVDLGEKVRQHFTGSELWSGGGILAALLVISVVKKIIVMAIVLVVLAGVAIAYQNGAFDSLLDNIQNTKTS